MLYINVKWLLAFLQGGVNFTYFSLGFGVLAYYTQIPISLKFYQILLIFFSFVIFTHLYSK